MADIWNLLGTPAVVLFLLFLLSVRKPWGRRARRIFGDTFLVSFIGFIIAYAAAAYIDILRLLSGQL